MSNLFADNSDDASDMDAFMAGITDDRVKFLASPAATLSMKDNWERVWTPRLASGSA